MSKLKKLFGSHESYLHNNKPYSSHLRPIEERYVQMLLTNTISNIFYADQSELLQGAAALHNEMAEYDPAYMAKAIVFARRQGLMRMQPLFGLAILSERRMDLFREIFSEVVLYPADLFDFLTVLQGMGRGQGGRAIKREVNRFLQQVTEYWAVKYSGRGRGYNLGDVVATAHPKPQNAKQQALFRYMRGLEAELAELPQVEAFEELKKAESADEQMYWIEKGKLPYETVTGAIQPSKAVWESLLYQMPMLALLRHLNALDRHGIWEQERNVRYAVERLTDQKALSRSKILPFRFAAAYRQCAHPELKRALSGAAELTFDHLPELPGRTAIFLDISGSMTGQYLEIGSVFALALYKKTARNSLFWLFDTRVTDANPSREKSILEQASRIRPRGGTDTGAPLRRLLGNKELVDQIIIITDERQNTGSPFYRELQAYRKRVNPQAQTFIVDISPYQNAMVPALDPLTHYIYGWSDAVLAYISQSVSGYESMAEQIRSGA